MAQLIRKSEVLTVRLAPEVKDALRRIAAAERRSLANMLEVVVLDYCSRHQSGDQLHDPETAQAAGNTLLREAPVLGTKKKKRA